MATSASWNSQTRRLAVDQIQAIQRRLRTSKLTSNWIPLDQQFGEGASTITVYVLIL
jgi:hypothetical protein